MLFADEDLARRLELADAQGQAEYVQTQRRLFPGVPTALLWAAGGCAVYAGPNSPFCSAVGLGMAGPVTAADLDLIEAFYRSHGAPTRVTLCPLADPSLAELLGRRGYRPKGFLNVLYRPVGPNDQITPPPPTGVAVELVGPDLYEMWAAMVSRGFQSDDRAAPEYPNIAFCSVHQAGSLGFLARLHGEPAGGANLRIHDRLACFSGASTRAPLRGHGVQTALLYARIAHAAATGCDVATVKTTPGSPSQRNAQRAGFAVAYSRLSLIKD